jgi:hypothetical protein
MPFRLFIKINLWAQNTIFLGLEIDEHLNWKKHIEEILPKLRSASYAVRSVYYTSSIATLKMICFAYFCLKLQNGIILWGTSTDGKRVFWLHKKTVRIMMGSNTRTSCKPSFRSLGILTQPLQYILSIMSFLSPNIEIYAFNSSVHEFQY